MLRVTRMVAWLGVAGGAVYLIYIGGGWQGIYNPGIRVATMTIAAVGVAAWAALAWRRPAWRPSTSLWPALALALGSLTISTIVSRDQRVSLEYLGYAIVLVALYLLLVRLFADPFFRTRLIAFGTMLFVVTTVLYLGQVAMGWLDWWSLLGHLGVPPLRPGFGGLTYGNPSAALTMVVLLAVVPAATYGLGRRGPIVIAAIVAAVAVVALTSGSRAGWFALGITAAGAVVAWLSGAARRARLRVLAGEIRRSPRMRGLAGVVALAVALGVLVLAPGVARRLLDGGEDLRLAYVVAALRMFGSAPIVGTGPGTWVIQRPAYTQGSDPDYYIPHAHDVPAQTLAELGIVGALAGGMVLFTVGRLFLAAARGDDPVRRSWALFGGLGLLYFGLHQLLDFYLNMPAFLFAGVLPVAYLDATAPASRPWTAGVPAAVPGLARRLASPAATIVLALAIVGLMLQEGPASWAARAVDAANNRDWATALTDIRNATDGDPDIASYWFTQGLAASWTGDHAAAAEAFSRVVGRADLPEAWLDLANEQVALGENSDAHASLQQAVRLGHQRPTVAMPIGDLAMRIGDRAMAIEAFANALSVSPSLAADPWWLADPARAALLPQATKRAVEIDPNTHWELALMTGDLAMARFDVDRSSTYQVDVTGAWGDDASAAARLDAYCDSGAIDLEALVWCARVAAHLHDDANAARYRRLVVLLSQGASFRTGELRVAASSEIDRQLPGGPADLWGTYTYRRPSPWNVLAPGLVHLTFGR
jgi:O-antigen ligase